jgi:hypothetical protein
MVSICGISRKRSVGLVFRHDKSIVELSCSQLTQVIGMGKDVSSTQENSRMGVTLLPALKIELLWMSWKTTVHGTWGRQKKSISANGAKMAQSLGKMKIQSRLVFYLYLACLVLKQVCDSGQGIVVMQSKNEIAILDLRITSRALYEGDTAEMRKSTNLGRR